MTDNNDNVIQKIQWRELFPWTLIGRSLGPAVSVSVIALATAGVIVNAAGWRVSEWIFLRESVREQNNVVGMMSDELHSTWQGVFESSPGDSSMGAYITGPYLVFHRIVDPYRVLFQSSGGLAQFFYVLLGILITIAIWAFVGTAIARIALLKYTRNESVSLGEAVTYACQQYVSAAACILVPLIGVGLLSIPGWIAGLLMAFNFGLFLGSLFYFIILALAIVMAIILLGLMFGWPLSIAAVGAEGQGFFDALTRSFAYTLHAPCIMRFMRWWRWCLAGWRGWSSMGRPGVSCKWLAGRPLGA